MGVRMNGPGVLASTATSSSRPAAAASSSSSASSSTSSSSSAPLPSGPPPNFYQFRQPPPLPPPQQAPQHHQPFYHDFALASLAYAPLHVPLQQSDHHHILQQQQQQHHHHQLALAAPQLSAAYQPFSPSEQQQRHLRLRLHARYAQAMAASSFQQPATSEEELAELQKLSNEYEPEVTGPLVGQRQPSTAITTEYASADPIFQAKTAALPQKYSHYRTVRGDGRCGWRAVAFGYFEALIHYGDPNRFLEEETRLRSSSNILNMAGYDPMLYEDFADETFDLLRKIGSAMQTGNAEEVLLEAFNDEMLQNFVMTHLKTLTSAWMKTRSQEYEPWLLGQTVDDYTQASVMPIGAEIDNVALSALKDAFLAPAGITLEILYLDRSEGNEVNMHRFAPVNNNGVDVGTIRLLYRPGHYDLLYKLEDLPPPAVPAQVPTYLQFASPRHPISNLGIGAPDILRGIPGMSYANLPNWMPSYSGYSEMDSYANTASDLQCTPAMPPPSVPADQPHMPRQNTYPPHVPSHHAPPPLHMPQELAIRVAPLSGMSPQTGFQPQPGGPFRPSAWELKPEFVQATSQTPLQTAIFRNSHFNTAHFMNPDFHPEEWRPDDEYVTPCASEKSARHRNSG